MGILLTKFRKKKTTLEILDTLENEIKSIEDFRRDTEQAQKRIVGQFVLISVGTYLLTAFVFYFYFFPANFYDQLFYIIPLIFAPVIIITVKRGLTWYYKRKISNKQTKLFTLREEKKKLLDNVKETETYKVAKSILEKYAPENSINRQSTGYLLRENNKTPMKLETPKLADTVLRQRALPALSHMPPSYVTPFRPVGVPVPPSTNLAIQGAPNQPTHHIAETQWPLPRAILPKERSVLDRMVDYLMGDGPSNRYALICKACFSHNGMAHKDEFEYVSFKCCYCTVLNAARKKRPGGPKLETHTKLPSSQSASDASESERNSESESENEPNKLIELEKEPEVENETRAKNQLGPEVKQTEPIPDVEVVERESLTSTAAGDNNDPVSNSTQVIDATS